MVTVGLVPIEGRSLMLYFKTVDLFTLHITHEMNNWWRQEKCYVQHDNLDK